MFMKNISVKFVFLVSSDILWNWLYFNIIITIVNYKNINVK